VQDNQVQDIVMKIARYIVVVFLLAGTMAFDALLFYAPDALSDAYLRAVQSLIVPFEPAYYHHYEKNCRVTEIRRDW
jgi:hypothetical protein